MHPPTHTRAGLAGALAFLKDRGELEAPVEWAGRTNDSKKVNIQVRCVRCVRCVCGHGVRLR